VALKRVAMPSPNYSSRGGTAVRLVVLHTAEGSTTIESLASYFSNPATQASSHVGIDNKVNTVGEMVQRSQKAWTQANANPYCVSAELCGFASWSTAEWQQNHANMLANCAAWIAEECGAFGIPLKRLNASQAQGGQAGVCQHADLGAAGGGHWDCGSGFPMDDVMEMAAGGRPNVGPTKRKGREMIASTSTGKGYWTTTSDGAVYTFGDAEFHGGANDPPKITGEVVGIAGKGTNGYWLLASDGGVFAFGSADYMGRPDRV
jgi:hypothetical protein